MFVIYQKPDKEISPNSLSISQIPLFSKTIVTVHVPTDTVRISTVSCDVRSNTKLYDTIPSVFDAVQYETPCNQHFVRVTILFLFVHGLKISKRNNTYFTIKYFTK